MEKESGMDSLTAQINAILGQYTSNVNSTVDQVMRSAANEAKRELTSLSPASTGKYAKSWAVKRRNATYTVYNKQPGLTHLLENGHDVVVNGKKVGRAPAHPHIAPVEEMIERKILTELEKKLS